MKLAETVTFGGSGLNRAAHLRRDAGVLRADERARAIPVWRGKPLFAGENRAPVWLPLDHPVLADRKMDVFLGLDEGAPKFAADISNWEPAEVPETLNAFFDPSEQTHPDLPKDQVFAELRGVMTHLIPRDAELVATGKALLGWHVTHGFCAKCGAQSTVSEGGWQRDCPACETHHFPRTDPVVIMLITLGNAVLVGRSPGWPEGMYSLLAGFVEPGETLEAAVRREVLEESGVVVGEVGYLASQPWPFPSSLMFGCHGHATSRAITIDPVEIEDARWVTREEMVDVLAGLHPEMKAARKGAIARFLIEHWLADRLD
jgi:NAD+ diphosphatase